jgi:acyl-coenzyme A synthetase/AMP-(fatty) acid ligase
VMRIASVLDARLRPDLHDEDAQCTLRVVARAYAHQGQLRREIIKVVAPKGLIREITFVEELERTRSGKPIRSEMTTLAVSLGGNGA